MLLRRDSSSRQHEISPQTFDLTVNHSIENQETSQRILVILAAQLVSIVLSAV